MSTAIQTFHMNSRRPEPRRPLVLPQESREILTSIRDSLKQTTSQGSLTKKHDSPDYSQAKHESVSSGPGGAPSLQKAGVDKPNKKKYNAEAMKSIREILKPYKTDSGNSSLESSSQDGSYDIKSAQQHAAIIEVISLLAIHSLKFYISPNYL